MPNVLPMRRVQEGPGQSVDAKSAFVTTSMGGEAYAQWVRRAIGHARAVVGRICSAGTA